eukprot:jgi/Tetstr1/447371/TSEL_034808.t1
MDPNEVLCVDDLDDCVFAMQYGIQTYVQSFPEKRNVSDFDQVRDKTTDLYNIIVEFADNYDGDSVQRVMYCKFLATLSFGAMRFMDRFLHPAK